MPIDSKFYKQKKAKSFYYAIAFLIFVIVLTWALYIYNTTIVNQNTDLDTNISRLESSIEKLKNDENIKAYSLYSSNKNTFDDLTAKSQVSDFIRNVKKTLSRYWLELWSFNYSDGKILVKVSSESDTRSKAYEKIVKFLKNYRESEESMFMLENISWVTGQDKLSFNVTFVVKK